MNLTEIILDAIKSKKVVFGYKESIKLIKGGKPKLVVISRNIPDAMRKQIEHNAEIFNLKVEVFSGSSKELGIMCGKPFPVSTLAIQE